MRIGILGSGQLGGMLAAAGDQLGHSCVHYDGDFTNFEQLSGFAAACDVITYEFENVPCETARFIESVKPVYPPPLALEMSQDRLTEKEFLQGLGIDTPRFAAAASEVTLAAACEFVGYPCIAKARRLGYDGKGQFRINSRSEVTLAWQTLAGVPLIVEEIIPFSRELSVIATRDVHGSIGFYPIIENFHIDGILHRSEIPAPAVSATIQEHALSGMKKILLALDYIGTLALELFEVNGRILANEMAPRVHNSGHATIEGITPSQFSNHIRAVTGMHLVGPTVMARAVMFNIIGKVPDLTAVEELPDVAVHLYGKTERPGRKLGHITLLDPTAAAEALVNDLCAR